MPDNLVFAGTPEFAVASLEALVDSGYVPSLVLTQPDRRSGRGRTLTPSPVKRYATARGLPVYQPESLKDRAAAARLAELRPRAVIVAAYGRLFPPDILDLPEQGCINVHASLLPRWRGAAPIQAAILHGDLETGISLMRMEQGLDTGPVYAREPVPIAASDTAGLLERRLAAVGGEVLVRHLPSILDGSLHARPQDDAAATYAGKIDREAARLDWRLPAERLERAVRAYHPRPGAWFVLEGEAIKCHAAKVLEHPRGAPDSRSGTIIAAGRAGIDVSCGEGVLRLLELQRPGRNPVGAHEFAAQRALPGVVLPA